MGQAAFDFTVEAETGEPEIREVRELGGRLIRPASESVRAQVALWFVLPLDADLVEEDGPAGFQPGAESASGVACLDCLDHCRAFSCGCVWVSGGDAGGGVRLAACRRSLHRGAA